MFGTSPGLLYKNIETWEWRSNNLGFLTRQRVYQIIDFIPSENGKEGNGFKEQYMLYANDSISYKHKDTVVIIYSNNYENCKALSYRTGRFTVYPPNFRSSSQSTLKFYPNNKISAGTFSKDSAMIQSFSFDKCGIFYNQRKKIEKIEWLERITSKEIECLSAEKLNILDRVDTISVEGRILLYEKNDYHQLHHRAMAPLTTESQVFKYYNLDLDIIYSESKETLTSDTDPHFRQTFRKKNYEYFKNGFLKKITTKDENDKIVEITAFKISYFDYKYEYSVE